MQIRPKQILRYMLLPDIAVRAKGLGLNLGWLAYLMALIFTATRILPRNHRYASPDQQGKFGISDILFEAGRHLKGGVRNFDQYLIFGSFVLGVGLLLAQFAILLFIVATHTAEASANAPWNGMFSTPIPDGDIALMMLDKVFEIPDFFNSKFDPMTDANITGFGVALHELFAFYNYGMLIIAGFIVLYFMFAVVIETMQTGTPFGQRFAEVYVPIRLILAVAFLLPLGYGFSAGQYLTLKLAEWGSAFATNGWYLFNQRASTNPLGLGPEQLIVLPKTQEMEDLIRFYALVHSCREIYDNKYGYEIRPYVVRSADGLSAEEAVEASSLSHADLVNGPLKDNIKIIFGEKNDAYQTPGHVKSYCGTLDVPVNNYELEAAMLIQEAYWNFVDQLWNDQNLRSYGTRMAKNFTGVGDPAADSITVAGWSDPTQNPEIGFYANVRIDIQGRFASDMDAVRDQIRGLPDNSMQIDDEILTLGWGGAGIWYNKIAEYNGAIVSATSSVPVPSSYPASMQWISQKKGSTNGGLHKLTQFTPGFRNGVPLTDMASSAGLDDPSQDASIISFLDQTYVRLSEENTFGDGTETHDKNPIADFFNMVFGTEGLFELRGNQQVHPLAKMSALGRSIIDRAITYLGGAMIMGGLSGLASAVDNAMSVDSGSGVAAGFKSIASMFKTFALTGLTVGVVLYYVIPFLPFLYFFFAVGRWVKSIFEALVGIPLWALAHLRIDGEGIPGKAAANGYYLLLEIALRPILVIFGLMASVGTFSALAIALDTVFDLVIKNVAGYSPLDETGTYQFINVEFKRGHVDQFFYTVMYAVILYMMALSCFKLIDLIPNSVLRFIGTTVSEFADKMNLEQDMIRTTGLATYSMAGKIGEVAIEAGELAGQIAVLPVNTAINMSRLAPKPPEAPTTPPPTPSQPPAPPTSTPSAPTPSAPTPSALTPSAPASPAVTPPQTQSLRPAQTPPGQTPAQTPAQTQGRTPPTTPAKPPGGGKK